VEGCRTRLDRDASAFEQADADEIANGTLYGASPINLTGQLGDGQGLRVRVEGEAENCSLNALVIALMARTRVGLHRKVPPFGATAPGCSTSAGVICLV
jgi:hypothetical protein